MDVISFVDFVKTTWKREPRVRSWHLQPEETTQVLRGVRQMHNRCSRGSWPTRIVVIRRLRQGEHITEYRRAVREYAFVDQKMYVASDQSDRPILKPELFVPHRLLQRLHPSSFP